MRTIVDSEPVRAAHPTNLYTFGAVNTLQSQHIQIQCQFLRCFVHDEYIRIQRGFFFVEQSRMLPAEVAVLQASGPGKLAAGVGDALVHDDIIA
ncbi:hypothetical protein ACO0LL_21840 [Undibacterium sp. TC4M20W]|uniref:hypothetical protein n=1 Tax=unclassified Undibacterium TaxID=2630295 RepID=UPI003BF1BB8D